MGKLENGYSKINKGNFGNSLNTILIYCNELCNEVKVIRIVQFLWTIDIVGITETVEMKEIYGWVK